MALYRQIYLTFWTDPKIDDDFTPEDKYFYLYLLTNPHTNICGCYELGEKQCCRETGYNQDTISRLLQRFQYVHNVIRYDKETREVLLLNWHKHNWTKSSDLISGVKKVATHIKSDAFREYILSLVEEGHKTVIVPSTDPRETSVTDTVTNTVTVSNLKENTNNIDSSVIEDMFGYNEFLLEAVTDWFKYKTERKEKYQPVGMKSLLTMIQNNVSKYGEDAVIEVIRESMGSGYKGILWDKLKQSSKPGKKNLSFADF